MYRHCIYCSADLGRNEALEGFPVGRTVAFDAEKGRLWAVCPKCARWNLAPIEERWEPVEAAEKAFADTRLRVQRGNIGIAKLRDGTRLVQVGAALGGELAAWRYGEQLTSRRRQYLGVVGAVTATVVAANVGGLLAVGGGCGEGEVIEAAREVLQTGAPRLLRIDLTEDLFSWSPAVCGGTFDVFLERVDPAPAGSRAA